jgi:DNA-binding HxlR family transcriptional regulator
MPGVTETQRFGWSTANCSIRGALEVVGEKWSLLVLREAYSGVRRFDDFHRAIGCPRNLLGERLGKLVDEGLLERVPYREPGQRTRHEYRLTAKGEELRPALVALMQWGDRWTADADGPPAVVRHRDCGAQVRAVLVCEAGHDALGAKELVAVPGPGARRLA